MGLIRPGVDGGDFSAESSAALRTLQKQQREEALKATVVLNLLADGSRDDVPDIVVQMPYRMEEKQDVVAHALALGRPATAGAPRAKLRGSTFERTSLGASSPYVQVHGSENTGKISAFSAFQPGTSRIFEELFQAVRGYARVLPLRRATARGCNIRRGVAHVPGRDAVRIGARRRNR